MSDLQNKISFDTGNSVSNIEALTVALKNYNRAARASAKATKSAGAGSKVIQGFAQQSTAAQSAAKQVQKYSNSVQSAANTTKRAAGQMVLSWQSVIRIFAIQTIHQGISKITSTLGGSLKASRDYQKQLAEIQTIGPKFKKDFAGLDEQVKAFSRLTGFSLDKSTSGLYQTLSNQVANTGDKFKFMKTAADLAVAGTTDLDSSVNLLSSAINSYGGSSENAANLGGKLFKTVELGRLKVEDIANSYGRVLGLSAQLGISFDEVNASMATLTRTGIDAHEAMTLITNTELKLAKPTKAMTKTFHDIGLASAEAGIHAFGFQGFLKEITKRGGESATELGKLFGRVRAVRGALGLTADAAANYADTLRAIKKASGDTLKEAKAFIFETNAKQLEMEFNDASVAVESFGAAANQALLVMIRAGGGGASSIKALATGVLAGAAAFAVMKIAGTAAMSAIISTVFGLKAALVALAVGPVGIAAAFAAMAVAAVIAFNKINAASKKSAKKLREDKKSSIEKNIRDIVRATNKELELYDKVSSRLAKGNVERVKTQLSAQNAQEQMVDSLKEITGKTSADEGKNLFDNIKDNAKSAASEVTKLKLAILGVTEGISDFKFGREQKRIGDDFKETFARLKKSDSLIQKSQTALRKGNKEESKFYQKRAEAQAKLAIQAADRTSNATLVRRAEDGVVRAMEAQQPLNKANLKQAQRVFSFKQREVIQARRIVQQFSRQAQAKPRPSDPALTSIVGDVDPLEQQRRQLQQNKVVRRGVAAQQDIAGLTGEISKNAIAVSDSIEQVRQFLGPSVLRGAFESILGDPDFIKKQVKGANQFAQGLTDTVNRISTAQKEGSTNTKAYAADIEALHSLQKSLPEGGLLGLDPKEDVGKLIKTLESNEEKFELIREKQPRVKAKDEIIEGIKKIKVESNAPQKAAEATKAIQGIEDKSVSINATTTGIEEAVAAIESIQDKTVTITVKYITEGAAPVNAYNGRLFRANGGGTRGHDKIPAMLSAGEFVVNARSTRNMFSQLVSANANSRYLGGSTNSVTNNNSNTFNVTGSSAPQQTAREISRLLKREQRIRK